MNRSVLSFSRFYKNGSEISDFKKWRKSTNRVHRGLFAVKYIKTQKPLLKVKLLITDLMQI